MTALMPDRTRPSAGELQRDLRHRRPLVLLATFAGAAAAAEHAPGLPGPRGGRLVPHRRGRPRHARATGCGSGALAWLMAHGSGVHVGGALVTVMPLGITLACAWATWRIGHRLGDAISGHGPDAERIADGERDWTVPAAALLFTPRATSWSRPSPLRWPRPPPTRPTPPRVRARGRSCCAACSARPRSRSAPAAPRSGRPRSRPPSSPPRPRAAGCSPPGSSSPWSRFLVALVLDFDTALNVTSQLHTDTGATVQLVVVSLLVVPNAVVFSGSYLLGPGFTVGDPHDRLAGRGHHRRAADVPAAGRPARHRPDTGVDVRPGRGAAARGGARGDAGPAPPPDVPLGGGRPARLRRRHARRPRCSACSRCSRAARSARAG